ncbi:MAG TPA: 4a-hydroxytetrahydrobiopterin dehydratase [Nocardioides sp.]|nr:4a-hydroxytetrahydrobiopterin dehydratase [uncultured Nocardioides sp.]HEX5986518.1 4a-hydroxytetrahydrobiopterin dehydratase [Nocardioides sp.]
MARLEQQEIDTALAGDLKQWTQDGDSLVRTVEAPSFLEAIDVVRRVAEVAEEADHHPDIDIRWRTLTFRLSTHSEGGITAKDLELAAQIDGLV